MRGAGGPLLCIGDLLSDVREASEIGDHNETTLLPYHHPHLQFLQILFSPHLNYPNCFRKTTASSLKHWLGRTTHGQPLTIKLCSALETADKLVQSNNSNIRFLLEKVEVLESIVKRGDSAVRSAKFIHDKHSNESSSIGN